MSGPRNRLDQLDRRAFLKASGLVSLGLGLGSFSTGRASANDTINIGLIGCNGMGYRNLLSMLDVPGTRCIALCDVDRGVLDKRVQGLTELNGHAPRTYGDYRALLDNKDIDAVIIGTPDHWHCLQMVDACDAGKDVYVEKPLANSIDECRRMVAAQEYHGRVVQVGQWQRSGPHWSEAIDLVSSGELGALRTVKVWAYMNWAEMIQVRPDEPVPAGVDYDMWLGPAPARPFNQHRFHVNFRWFWDYAGGLMTDWGVHLIDIALWGTGAKFPNRIMSGGGKFADPGSAMETPDTQQAIYEYDDFTMIWEHAVGIGLGPFQRSHGIAFVGNNGTLVVDRSGWELFPESSSMRGGESTYRMAAQPPRRARPEARGLNQHAENFVDCMRTRSKPNCDVAAGNLAAINAHLGNIALRTGDTLEWDSVKYRFRGNRQANDFLKPDYRRPWRLPR
ncbi:MAG: Gfo/Idh/MocA family oxidoreductase [Pseudomonadota bacterium]|nr:Gfo/Idh/MocA family oxidoreductase [Pseudomonadota bacterium]